MKHKEFITVLVFFCAAFILAIIIGGCKKDKATNPTAAQPTPYYVRMTDAPAAYSAVNVDIQAVQITGNGTTVNLNVTPGIYNLLDFANGADTLIATGLLNITQVEQIRLILGPNNSVVIGNTTYPLSTPSAQQSGLKLQVHQQLQAGVAYYVLLDFDANASIVVEGNGTYSLKPVIKTIDTPLGGSIKGFINPPGVSTTITAVMGATTYSTLVNSSGDFILSGLPAGTYSLSAVPVTPYTTATVTGIGVVTGSTTSTGTLNI